MSTVHGSRVREFTQKPPSVHIDPFFPSNPPYASYPRFSLLVSSPYSTRTPTPPRRSNNITQTAWSMGPQTPSDDDVRPGSRRGCGLETARRLTADDLNGVYEYSRPVCARDVKLSLETPCTKLRNRTKKVINLPHFSPIILLCWESWIQPEKGQFWVSSWLTKPKICTNANVNKICPLVNQDTFHRQMVWE